MGDGSAVLEGAASPTWAVVLARGEGTRLRSLTREGFGDERPKQYAPLMGAESLLGQTLDRTSITSAGVWPPASSSSCRRSS